MTYLIRYLLWYGFSDAMLLLYWFFKLYNQFFNSKFTWDKINLFFSYVPMGFIYLPYNNFFGEITVFTCLRP